VAFWSTLAEQLWSAWTPVLVLSYFVTAALVRYAPRPIERYHMRAAGTFVLGHVLAVGIGTGQLVQGYDATIAEICALAFKAFATVTLAMTALFRALLPRVGVVLPRILIDLLTGLGTVVAFIVIGRRAGFSVAGLITTSAVLTAVIGFSLQDTLGNVMGGLSVQLDKSISVGDWVVLAPGQPSGQVIEIRWRYTAIQTRTGDTLIVPNGAIVKSQVTVLGRRLGGPPRTRRQIDFFVDFRTPPTEVIGTVERALRADPVPRMAREPAPQALFFGLRDSYAHYCVRYWLEDLAVDDPTDSAVRIRVWFALRRANIPMSIPASSVFVTHETPERAERKAADELSRRLAALGSVDLFRGLPEQTRQELAGDLAYTPFAAGEAITREGDRDEGLYMLVSGEAIVRIGSGAEARDVARLVPGQFFGEMSLMTGEARTASVIAATDAMCYRVDKPAFQRILHDTPGAADQIAGLLAARRMELDAARDERDEQRRGRMENVKQDLLGKIRSFFGLDRAA
jgi:small-conductance mechanosensitive channel/CRP-like cAMP-binding protein